MDELLAKVKKYKKILNDSNTNQETVLLILKKLEHLPISLDILETTGIGKTVGGLRKQDGKVAERSRLLVAKWKKNLEGVLDQDNHRLNHEDRADSTVKKSSKQEHSKEHSKELKTATNKTKTEISGSGKIEAVESKNKITENHTNKSRKHKLESSPTTAEKKQRSHSYLSNNNAPSEDKFRSSSKKSIITDSDDEVMSNVLEDKITESPQKLNTEKTKHHDKVRNVANPSSSGKKEDSKLKIKNPELNDESVNNIEENGMSFDDFLNCDALVKTKSVDKQSAGKREYSKKDVKKTDSKFNHSSSTDDYKVSKPNKSKEEKINSASSENNRKSTGDSKSQQNTQKHKSSNVEHAHGIKSKKSKEDTVYNNQYIPKPDKQLELKEADIMSTLPDISPNYHPLPQSARVNFSKDEHSHIDDAIISAKKQSRTLIYSGKKHSATLNSVPRLFDSCIQVLRDNIEYLGYVGGIPASILMPVLERCSPVQLYNLEDMNPHFVGDTEDLWKKHCNRDFKSCVPEEMEFWRELYLRKHDERDAKLKSVTESIQTSAAKKTIGRQTKLAFVDSYVKPPRDVKRKQLKYGTASVSKHSDAQQHKPSVQVPSASRPIGSSLAALSSPVGSSLAARQIGSSLSLPSSDRPRKTAPKIAPMMAKTLKMIKKWQR